MFIDWLKAMIEGSMGGLGAFIFIGIVVVGTVVVAVSKRKKVFYGFLVLALGFFIYAKCTCGPSFSDVRVMYPMADKISGYITKHGIPKSLKDIPNLPYELEGCVRSEEYLNMIDGYMKKVSKEKAILYNFREECSYSNIKLQFWLQNFLEEHTIGISLTMNSADETYLEYGGGAGEDEKIRFNEKNIGSSKTSGICNSMKQ
jgi:hypothetical protein